MIKVDDSELYEGKKIHFGQGVLIPDESEIRFGSSCNKSLKFLNHFTVGLLKLIKLRQGQWVRLDGFTKGKIARKGLKLKRRKPDESFDYQLRAFFDFSEYQEIRHFIEQSLIFEQGMIRLDTDQSTDLKPRLAYGSLEFNGFEFPNYFFIELEDLASILTAEPEVVIELNDYTKGMILNQGLTINRQKPIDADSKKYTLEASFTKGEYEIIKKVINYLGLTK